MGAGYLEICHDRDVLDRVEKMKKKYHSKLCDFDVTIAVVMANRRRDDDGEWVDGSILSLHGYTCEATIKVTSNRDRLHGIADAELTINGEIWRDLDPDEKDALIDHELEHLELIETDKGDVKWDDHGRPKLRCRKHDWQLGGFLSVLRRHQAAAREVTHVQSLISSPGWTQMQLPWPEPSNEPTLTIRTDKGEVTTTPASLDEAAEKIVKHARRKLRGKSKK